MPVARFQMPDGRIGRFEVPDGTTPEQAQTLISAQIGVTPQPQKRDIAAEIANDPISQGAQEVLASSPADRLSANPIIRTLTSAARPALGAAALVEKLWGGTSAQDRIKTLDEMQARGGQALYPQSAKAQGVAQDLAGGLLGIGGAATKLPSTATTAGRITQGAQLGALGGVTSGSDKPLEAAGVGAAIGGGVPAGWELAKGLGALGRNIAQPFTGQSGLNQATGRLANEVAGSNQPAVQTALENAAPRQTAGQAAVPSGSAEFAALHEIGASRDPSLYRALQKAQDRGRIDAIRTVGKDVPTLEQAISTRGANAATNYGDAYAQTVRANPDLAVLVTNPYIKDEIPTALKLAEANGINPKTDLTQFLHYVKIGLDKQLSKTGNDSLSSTQQKAVADAKTALVDWVAKANPKYDAARAAFAAESKPINQMQIGQELEKKLVPALSEDAKQRAAVFAQSLRDAPQTIKRATGNPYYDKLEDILTAPQMDTVNSVKSSLATDAEHARLAGAGAPEALRRIRLSEPEIPSAGMFSPKISVARAVINQVTGGATDKTLNNLAKALQDPAEMARIMQSAKPFERQQLADMLMKYQAATAGQQGAR